MSGYDRKRFINLSEKDAEDYTCAICKGVLNNPVAVPCCQNVYCRVCIETWLNHNSTCPLDRKPVRTNQLIPASRPFINLLSRLEIRCEFAVKGCDETPKLGDMVEHLTVCGYNVCAECLKRVGKPDKHDCVKNLRSLAMWMCSEKKRMEEEHRSVIREMKITHENVVRGLKMEIDGLRSEQEIYKGKMKEAQQQTAFLNKIFGDGERGESGINTDRRRRESRN